ncbi:MAG: hypothetical protein FWG78_04385 [Coriobacteriia bacterium]|nr:hypothetical protein [Coriobacteriia bacterium]
MGHLYTDIKRHANRCSTTCTNRRTAIVVTLLIVLLLILLGTFALEIIENAAGQLRSGPMPSALLVDTFRRINERNWEKLVRVENVGEDPFIVRISAAEFMQFLPIQGPGGSILDGSHAPPIPSVKAIMDTTFLPTTWVDGGSGSYIDTQTAWFDVAPSQWSRRGLTDGVSLAAAAPNTGHAADAMNPFAVYWSWDQPYMMSFAQWETALPHERDDRWILCDDGYFYYTMPIEGSSLPLMTGVSATPDFPVETSAFYYAIALTMEAVTRDDVFAMRDGGLTAAGEITLVAASNQGKTVIDSIWPLDPLEPQAPIGPTPSRIDPPSRVIYDGIPFYRIATVTHGETIYDLLVTQFTYDRGTRFNQTTGDGNFWLSRTGSASTKSNLMTGVDAWWNTRAGSELRARAVFPSFTGFISPTTPTTSTFAVEGLTNVGTVTWANVNFTRFPDARSRPSAAQVENHSANTQPLTGGGIVMFPLAGVEIMNYFPDSQTTGSGGAAVTTTNTVLGRIARDATATSTSRSWWARTRGGTATTGSGVGLAGVADFGFGYLNAAGTWFTTALSATSVSSTTISLRPALWVKRIP